MKPARDVYQEVTDKIVAAMEAGCIPWIKPWKASKGGDQPHNAGSGRQYSGVNYLLLTAQQWHAGYESCGWITYKQAQELGGNVKKGEKGTGIVFWQFREVEKDGERRVIPFAKSYTVFNVGQCEGLTLKEYAADAIPATEIDQRLAAAGVRVQHGGDRAFFSPAHDYVQMPRRDAFPTLDAYHAVLLHEATHWTGHKSRLNRDFSGRFGDAAYATEELVAEMGAAFLSARFGVELQTLQHAGYLQHWIQVLKADKRAIFTAASAATKAANFLLAEREEMAEAA